MSKREKRYKIYIKYQYTQSTQTQIRTTLYMEIYPQKGILYRENRYIYNRSVDVYIYIYKKILSKDMNKQDKGDFGYISKML